MAATKEDSPVRRISDGETPAKYEPNPCVGASADFGVRLSAEDGFKLSLGTRQIALASLACETPVRRIQLIQKIDRA